mmetsp:Transcript_10632/g.28355  ORF Transcript_10632/g.28355 Transcript_10632/m.28355 type:complete len:455 (-) Transcript_10632:166-1530(-)
MVREGEAERVVPGFDERGGVGDMVRSYWRVIVMALVVLMPMYHAACLFRPLVPGVSTAVVWFAALQPLQQRLIDGIRRVRSSSPVVRHSALLIPVLAVLMFAMIPSAKATEIIISLAFLSVYVAIGALPETLLSALTLWLFGMTATVVVGFLVTFVSVSEMTALYEDVADALEHSSLEAILESSKSHPYIEAAASSLSEIGLLNKTAIAEFKLEHIHHHARSLSASAAISDAVRTQAKAAIATGGSVFSWLAVFAIVLLYLLQNAPKIRYAIRALSPFDDDDHAELGKALQMYSRAIIWCGLLLFTVHFVLTAATIRYSGLQLPIISLATIAGVLAVFPLAPGTLIWIVICGALAADKRFFDAGVIFGVNFAVGFFVKPAIYALVPSGHYYLSSMSVALGLSAYGAPGIVMGPVILCSFVTGLKLVAKHLRAEQPMRPAKVDSDVHSSVESAGD